MRRQGIEQVGHHFQIDHRCFVDYQYIQRQAIARVMAEVPRAGAATEQAVNGSHVAGDFLPNLVVHFQRLDLQADRFGQAGGRFTGRRGKTNAQGRACLYRWGL